MNDDTRINQWLHEAMGLCWHEWEVSEKGTGGFKVKMQCQHCPMAKYRSNVPRNPRYDTDLTAAFEIQAFTIEKVGLDVYGETLRAVMDDELERDDLTLVPPYGCKALGMLASATAAQRARACYNALAGEEESEWMKN